MIRLPFVLPALTRVAWVSGDARAVWAPRLERAARAWRAIERASLARGVRPAMTWVVAPDGVAALSARARADGLDARVVRRADAPSLHVELAVGRADAVAAIADAARAGDGVAEAIAAGAPGCCARAEHHARAVLRHLDPTWPVAVATAGGEVGDDVRTLVVGGAAAANPLWRWLGIRAVPHLACRFDCAATAALAAPYAALLRDEGYADEAALIDEVLGWSAEWSALHGLAEIRTPILRLTVRTDATPHTYRVARRGAAGPREAAAGLRFPYRRPGRLRVLESRAFHDGLAHAAATADHAAPAGAARAPAPAAARPPGATQLLVDEGFARLDAGHDPRRIRRLRAGPYFTVVELDDGGVGAAMSYYREPAADLERFRRWGEGRAVAACHAPDAAPPSLRAPLLVASFRVALQGAMLARAFADGGGPGFVATAAPRASLFAGVRRAAVVGFGGYLHALAATPTVIDLLVVERGYPARRAEIDAAIAALRARRAELTIEVVAAPPDPTWATRDLVAITGSALCNDTMAALLPGASGPRVVVQGQSAAIHPGPLFERGVAVVATTRKPTDLIDRADAGTLPAALEGALAPLFLSPRG